MPAPIYSTNVTTTPINGSQPLLTAAAKPTLLSIDGQRKAVLTNAIDVAITEQMLDTNNGQEVLDFTLPLDNPQTALIDNEMQISFAGSVFRVRLPSDGVQQDGSRTNAVHCEALWYDLGMMDAIVVNPGVTTPAAALGVVLAGTGWTAGTTVSVSSGTYTSTQHATPLAHIRALPSVFGGEIVFDNVHKTVSLVAARGNQSGQTTYIHGVSLTSSQRQRDTTNLCSRVRPIGANGIDITSVNGGIAYLDDYSFFTSRGATSRVLAQLISNDAISQPTALLAWGRSQLAVLSQPKYTYTVTVANLATAVTAVPGLGDRVRVVDPTINISAWSRIAQRTFYPLEPWRTVLQVNTAAYTLAQAIAGTPSNQVNGAGSQSGGLLPSPPASVTVTTSQSVDADGHFYTFATASWPAVTTYSDGSPISNLNNYEVEYQVDGGSWTPLGRTSRTIIQTPPFRAQASLVVRVQAWTIDGNNSGWTQSSVTAVHDTSPPNAPSTPVLATRLPLALEVSWNGLDSGAAAMPADFAYVEVHYSTTTGFTPSSATLGDTISNPAGGVGVLTQLTQGTTYFVKLRAVDRTGNVSAASAQASGVPALIPAGSYAALSIVDAAIGSVSAGKITVGSLVADVTISARIKTADTGARVELNSTGLKAYNAGGTNTVAINNDGSASFTGTVTGSTIIGSTIETASSGARVVLNSNLATNNFMEFWAGVTSEQPGFLTSGTATPGAAGSQYAFLQLQPGGLSGTALGTGLTVIGQSKDNTTSKGQFTLNAESSTSGDWVGQVDSKAGAAASSPSVRMFLQQPSTSTVNMVSVQNDGTHITGGLFVGAVGTGTELGSLGFGGYSGTTDASGFLVVTHGLGFTPSRVFVQTTSPSSGSNISYPIVTAITSTTFTIRYIATPTGGTSASIAVTGHWLALA